MCVVDDVDLVFSYLYYLCFVKIIDLNDVLILDDNINILYLILFVVCDDY